MNRDPDIQPLVDTTGWIPMQLQPANQLQLDAQRLEPFAHEPEMATLQGVYDKVSYADLTLDELKLMRELEVRSHGG